MFLVVGIVFAAAPTRSFTYTTGTTISSSEVTTNEDNIYNYLQAGVDTYKDDTIVNADINSAANIDDTKLDLATIAQAVVFNGTAEFNATTTFAGITITDLGTVTTANIDGGTIDGATLGASSQVTISNADINDGTLDGVQIGGTTATGELIVNNASDEADGLGAQGTTGQVLTSAGAGANPTFSDPDLVLVSVTNMSAVSGSGDITIEAEKLYLVIFNFTQSAATHIDINFDNSTGASEYVWMRQGGNLVTTTNTPFDEGDTTDSSIELKTGKADGFRTGKMLVNTRGPVGNIQATVTGHEAFNTATGEASERFAGRFEKSGSPTTVFEMTAGSGTLTGDVFLYRYETSL